MAVSAARQEGRESGGPGQRHLTSTDEQGRFCVARCSCGWRGPARRARSQARTDAEGHLAAP
ncbi:hypothetical protein NX794_05085 [Streptomyces sp. LP11]|uniref:Uncharacterized protein n=1 Tax=Streptomyces pyxinicus TaxID=2970331 RepID=A0ABT2AWI0_9ACTN|nr:hypothetical protein [Streptomyces sp. LP11]MCS0600608.1 hypothetical protein [Streptomyces sp. LP11]